jgi:hypothetical protein
LAHECGHLLFDDAAHWPVPIRDAIDSNIAADDEFIEFMCNTLANELLLPSWTLREVARSQPSLDDICGHSRRMRVSLSMFVYRLNNVGPRNVLLHLRRTQRGDWLITDRLGLPFAWSGHLRLGQSTMEWLSGAPASSFAQLVDMEIERAQSPAASVIAQLRRSKESAVALFPLSALGDWSTDIKDGWPCDSDFRAVSAAHPEKIL